MEPLNRLITKRGLCHSPNTFIQYLCLDLVELPCVGMLTSEEDGLEWGKSSLRVSFSLAWFLWFFFKSHVPQVSELSNAHRALSIGDRFRF